MKISIIGATSFLAKNLIDNLYNHLSHFENIHLYSRNSPNIFKANPIFSFTKYNYPQSPIISISSVEDWLSNDIIIYCAGAGIQPKHQDSPEDIFEINAFEPIRLINLLKKIGYKGKLITFGSYFEIGNNSIEKLYAIKDFLTHQNKLPNSYCEAKYLLTSYIQQCLLNQELPFVLQHFILTNIYGENENKERLIPYIIFNSIKGEHLKFSSGIQKRQYTYIQDIVDFLIHSLLFQKDKKKSGIFPLTHPQVHTVKEVIEEVLVQLNEKKNIHPSFNFGDTSKRDLSMYYLAMDCQITTDIFEWTPKISLKEGISHYFDEKNW
jgi:nucleoside-diphosphate-sugar epimerase